MLGRKKILLLWCLSLQGLSLLAQREDSLLIRRILERLTLQQVTQDGTYFAGTFPTFRIWSATPSLIRTDNSIFFTGLIVFTLNQLAPDLHGDDRLLCDSLIQRAVRSYPHFRNRKGDPTFNFWPSDRSTFFPNSMLDKYEQSKQIADDLDDTTFLWLGVGIPDSTARRLKAVMDRYSNGRYERIRNTYRYARDLPAYSTWFGKKTPIEFDAGIFTNSLYFVKAVGLPLDVHDTAAIDFVRYVLEKRKYVTDPAYASSYYARTPVIMYHLARLLDRFPLPELTPYAAQLTTDTRQAFLTSKDPVDRVLLGTSLLRLGDTTHRPVINRSLSLTDWENDPFVFYIANLGCLFPNPLRRLLLHSRYCIYRFYSPSYNDALLLEYLLLRRSFNPTAPMSWTRNP